MKILFTKHRIIKIICSEAWAPAETFRTFPVLALLQNFILRILTVEQYAGF